MGTASIPVRLSIEESSAIALKEAADDLANARDTESFLAALETNHRLWLTLAEVARRHGWKALDRRLAEFVTATTATAGRGVPDEHLETLIGINREVSARLTRNADSARRRALLAWQEYGKPYGLKLDNWLIAEIRRKAHYMH